MEGTLQKWTNYIFGWRERWVVLRGTMLYYYIDKTEKPKGRIHIGITNIMSNDEELTFELDTGTSILYFKAETMEEKNKWVCELKKAKLAAQRDGKSIPPNVVINESEINKNRNINSSSNSVVTEDKIIRKINFALQTTEKLKEYQTQLDDEISKIDKNNNIINIYDNMKEGISSITSQLEDLKTNFVKFNREFIKISELFFDHHNGSKDYRGGGFINQEEDDDINDNNLIVKAKNSKRMSFQYNKKSEEDLVMFDDKKDTILKENEYFYTVEDDDEPTPKEILVNVNQSVSIPQSSFTHKKFIDPLYTVKRTKLPFPKKKFSFNPWSILKDAIGKDLNKFGVPVFFNEPISMLQKLCENFQYAYVLNDLSKDPSPYARLCLAASFCIGGFTMNVHRAAKYFNPLLGETFEYIDKENGYKYFSEQVSHHPAISACYVEGDNWIFYANSNAKTKFVLSGRLEVENVGRSYISVPSLNEQIYFTKPMIVAKNLIFGTITLDIYGKFYVGNNSGDICEVNLEAMNGNVQGNLKGEAKDIYGNVKMIIEGNWLDKIEIYEPDNKTNRRVIWRFIQGEKEEEYYFPPITFDLNNLTEEMKTALPRTDSRFRPDQRLLEMQELDKAADEKHRLEEKQRRAKKERDKKGIIYKPLYFDETYDDITGELVYLYKGGYFEDRYNKNFDKFPDLFSEN